jgi:drug/metabolite transporter (DMT)-like permease
MAGRYLGYGCIGMMLILSFASQVQLKLLATEVNASLTRTGPNPREASIGLLQVVGGWRGAVVIMLAGLLFGLWLTALTKLELSAALPLVSIGLVINAIGGGLMLGEPISLIRAAGTVVVAIGITMVLMS